MCEIVCNENWECWIECTDYQARSSGIAKFVIGKWRATIGDDVHVPEPEDTEQGQRVWSSYIVPNNTPNDGNELHLVPSIPITMEGKWQFSFKTNASPNEVGGFTWETREVESRELKERGHIKKG
jgi:hypothetical protein